MENDIWEKLYNAARKVQNARTISPFIEAGGVAAALLTKSGNIYVGVCIDTACTLGMCAEQNAIANMITNDESKIDKVVAIVPNGKVGSPCGACREYMMQLDKDSGEIEILVDYENRKTVRLKELPELNFPVIRTNILKTAIFHAESALDCSQLNKSKPLVKMTCMNVRRNNSVELQNSKALFMSLFYAVFHKPLSNVKPPAF